MKQRRRPAPSSSAGRRSEASARTGYAAPVYVIGTEVPAPGGERAGAAGPAGDAGDDAGAHARMARDGLRRGGPRGRLGAGRRRRRAARRRVRRRRPSSRTTRPRPPAWPPRCRRVALVFEAHSTDYQTPAALAELVRDGFAILKVGPWLTFALREALFALEAIERELLGSRPGPSFPAARDAGDAMLADPATGPPTTTATRRSCGPGSPSASATAAATTGRSPAVAGAWRRCCELAGTDIRPSC